MFKIFIGKKYKLFSLVEFIDRQFFCKLNKYAI